MPVTFVANNVLQDHINTHTEEVVNFKSKKLTTKIEIGWKFLI